MNNFKIFFGILFGPLALLVSIELIGSSVSSGRIGERKIVLLFYGQGRISMLFFVFTIFLFIFTATLTKKLLR